MMTLPDGQGNESLDFKAQVIGDGRASAMKVADVVSAAESREMQASLSQIKAAPHTSLAFDLAEALAAPAPMALGMWRAAFRGLVTDARFAEGWARTPFKLAEKWTFASGAYSMADVESDITRLPPQFVAHGVEYQGGIYNKPMTEGFTWSEVDGAMDGNTVVMLNAGFVVPKLAAVSLAMLEATQLPIWLNVYLSKPGLVRSTQLHTDMQDVLLVQCTGRKRWRVYRPPPPSETPALNPFQRGKGTDHMKLRAEDLLLDTIMTPGDVLYVPAGFPHETDTIGDATAETDDELAKEPAVHLTVGVDTHLWRLNYANLREIALARAGERTELANGMPLTQLPRPEWSALHTPLPVGFLAAPMLAPLNSPSVDDARSALIDAMARDLDWRMRTAEPERWSSDVDLVETLELRSAVERMQQHYRSVLDIQERMYRTALRSADGAAARAFAITALFAEMDALDQETAALDAWARGEARVAPEKATKSAGFGKATARKKGKGKGKKR